MDLGNGGGGDYIFHLPTIGWKSYDEMGENEDDVVENGEVMLKPSIPKPMYQKSPFKPCIGLISISPPPMPQNG